MKLKEPSGPNLIDVSDLIKEIEVKTPQQGLTEIYPGMLLNLKTLGSSVKSGFHQIPHESD